VRDALINDAHLTIKAHYHYETRTCVNISACPPISINVILLLLPAAALTLPALIELLSKQEREIVNLRRQVAWFQRQIFGQKSERRLPEPEGVQVSLGEAFAAIPDVPPSERKSRVASHERAHKPKQPTDGADESTLLMQRTQADGTIGTAAPFIGHRPSSGVRVCVTRALPA
jgi:hypothetical protein